MHRALALRIKTDLHRNGRIVRRLRETFQVGTGAVARRDPGLDVLDRLITDPVVMVRRMECHDCGSAAHTAVFHKPSIGDSRADISVSRFGEAVVGCLVRRLSLHS
jgi:hypothetical protein